MQLKFRNNIIEIEDTDGKLGNFLGAEKIIDVTVRAKVKEIIYTDGDTALEIIIPCIKKGIKDLTVKDPGPKVVAKIKDNPDKVRRMG